MGYLLEEENDFSELLRLIKEILDSVIKFNLEYIMSMAIGQTLNDFQVSLKTFDFKGLIQNHSSNLK